MNNLVTSRDCMEDLAHLVERSLEVTFRVTSYMQGGDKRIQLHVRHRTNPGETYSVLGSDVWDVLPKALKRKYKETK